MSVEHLDQQEANTSVSICKRFEKKVKSVRQTIYLGFYLNLKKIWKYR